MSKASPLSQQIMSILQKKGQAVETGPKFHDIVAAVKSEAKTGRPKKQARLDIRSRYSRPGLEEKNSHVLVIRDGNKPPVSTRIVIKPGMDPREIEIAGEIALDDHNRKEQNRFLREHSSVDVGLRTIVDGWIDAHVNKVGS